MHKLFQEKNEIKMEFKMEEEQPVPTAAQIGLNLINSLDEEDQAMFDKQTSQPSASHFICLPE